MQRDAAGWAAPVRDDPARASTGAPPIDDGPVSSWNKKVMTVNGTISATTVLFILLLMSASFGWSQASGPDLANGEATYQMPPIAWVGIIVGFIAVIVASFKPALAKFLGPVYSIGYGFAVGAISRMYESFQDGIVVQADRRHASRSSSSCSCCIARRIIKVTDKFRRTVIFATLGILVLYGVSFLMSPLRCHRSRSSAARVVLGIGFSVLGLRHRGDEPRTRLRPHRAGRERSECPRTYEWVSALGLLVTHRLAVPRDAPPAVQAPAALILDVHRQCQPTAPALVEAAAASIAAAVLGGALSARGSSAAPFGLAVHCCGHRRRERRDLRMAPDLPLVLLDGACGVYAGFDLVAANDVGRVVRKCRRHRSTRRWLCPRVVHAPEPARIPARFHASARFRHDARQRGRRGRRR